MELNYNLFIKQTKPQARIQPHTTFSYKKSLTRRYDALKRLKTFKNVFIFTSLQRH